MKKIVTIWGGNGHSQLLKWLRNSSFFSDISLKSIVSMSDDGRTTGELMWVFEETLWRHLPPPWDLRRCLFSLSQSSFRKEFETLLEQTIESQSKIWDLNLGEMLEILSISSWLKSYISKKQSYIYDFNLPIDAPISGHKFGNILMATLYYNFLYDYNFMLNFMHQLLEVEAKIIPVTTDMAFIEAVLEDGTIIQKQDNISNSAGYNKKIHKLRLMESSKNAQHNYLIDEAIWDADYIILSPWDLFTSTISNLIIGNISQLIQKSNAKIIFVCNTTNKWWETENYTILDFVVTLESYLGKAIDILLVNEKYIELSDKEKKLFKSDISVKWWDYIYLTDEEKWYFQNSETEVVEAKLLKSKTLYKHDTEKLAQELWKIISR